MFAGNHLLTVPKPMSECYVIERFVGTVAQRSVCVKTKCCVRWQQDRAFVLINQGQRRSSNLGFRTLHAEQERNTLWANIAYIYIGGILPIRYIGNIVTSAIYTGVPIHRSSSDCLIIQNRHAMQSMERSMDSRLNDNIVDSLCFCTTLTGRRGGHTHLHKQERKRPTPVRRWLSWTQALLGRVILGVSAGDENAEFCGVVYPLHWWSTQCATCMLLSVELINRPCSAEL